MANINVAETFEAECVLFNADDDRPDTIWNALWLQLAHRTPECMSDEGAFTALAFIAREVKENLRSPPAYGNRAAVGQLR